MEILKKGNKVYECAVCGCQFALDKRDIIYHYRGIYGIGDMLFGDYTSKDYDYVFCPQCSKRVKVEQDI